MNAPGEPAHIAINAHLLSLADSYRGAGIHQYIRALLKHLPQVASYRFTAFLGDPRARQQAWPGLHPQWARFSTQHPLVRILWEQGLQPLHLLREKVDLVHGPAYALPWITPTRSVVTIHDLSFFLYPHLFNTANRLYLRMITRLSVQRADAIIAVSQHTRRDFMRLFGQPADRITVIPNGISRQFRPLPAADVQAFRRNQQLPAHFILCLSTIEPRKNLGTLIRAYARLKNKPWPLIIGGGQGWKYQHIFALVEQLGLQKHVHFPGYLPQDQLPYWYNAADLFVYPSLYEGFGLPPLEAMACGTPVIASNAASLPEVVGSAGRLVPPTDVEALAEAMDLVLRDATLRQEMVAQGLARAGQFSWKTCARRTATVYGRLLGHITAEGVIDGVTT